MAQLVGIDRRPRGLNLSLVYVRGIKANIIRFRRRQRLRQLIDDVVRIQDDAKPLSTASRAKLSALKRNIPLYAWSHLYAKGRVALEIHAHIDAQDMVALKEALYDWSSYSEDA
jgi:hypothetical protein